MGYTLRYQHAEADGIGHTYFLSKSGETLADDGVPPDDALNFDTADEALASPQAAALVEAGRVPQAIDLDPPTPSDNASIAKRLDQLEAENESLRGEVSRMTNASNASYRAPGDMRDIRQ